MRWWLAWALAGSMGAACGGGKVALDDDGLPVSGAYRLTMSGSDSCSPRQTLDSWAYVNVVSGKRNHDALTLQVPTAQFGGAPRHALEYLTLTDSRDPTLMTTTVCGATETVQWQLAESDPKGFELTSVQRWTFAADDEADGGSGQADGGSSEADGGATVCATPTALPTGNCATNLTLRYDLTWVCPSDCPIRDDGPDGAPRCDC